MIRAVASKKLALTDEEYEYYKQLRSAFGDDEFRGLFYTDDNGNITSIAPPASKPTAMVILFFLLNVMLNQRLRGIDKVVKKIDNLERRIKRLEKDKKAGK